jgi:hypothetical protein
METLSKRTSQETLLLLKEFGNLTHFKLVFIFSEKIFSVHQMLLKYNLNDKIYYLCDPRRLYFDKFNINELFNGSQRKTKLFFFKSNKMLKEMEFKNNAS